MPLTMGERIKALRNHYNLSVRNFADGSGISHVTVFKLEKGAQISDKSILKIVSVYGTTREWLLYGEGEMLPAGDSELPQEKINGSLYWKEKAYREMERKGALLEKEIEKLWTILDHITGKR